LLKTKENIWFNYLKKERKTYKLFKKKINDVKQEYDNEIKSLKSEIKDIQKNKEDLRIQLINLEKDKLLEKQMYESKIEIEGVTESKINDLNVKLNEKDSVIESLKQDFENERNNSIDVSKQYEDRITKLKNKEIEYKEFNNKLREENDNIKNEIVLEKSKKDDDTSNQILLMKQNMEQYLSSIVGEKDIDDALKLFEEEHIKRLKPLIFEIPAVNEDGDNFEPRSLSEVIHSLKVRIRSYFNLDHNDLIELKPSSIKDQINIERKKLDQLIELKNKIESELHLLTDDYGKTFLLRTQRYFTNTLNEIKENGTILSKNVEEFQNLYNTLNKYNEEIINIKEEYEKDREIFSLKITNLENEVYVLRERNGEIGNKNNIQVIDQNLVQDINHLAILLENNIDPNSFKDKIKQSLTYHPQTSNSLQIWETISQLNEDIEKVDESENFRNKNLQEKEIEAIKRVSDIKEITKRSKPFQNDLNNILSRLNNL